MWQYEYYLKDHLGNTRVIFTDDGTGEPTILQEADYYPFGMRHDRSVTATNHYLYNGKELNTDLGLDWYDYGFRWYDAEIGRFPSVDPIIENFPDLTPYNYASNNPSTLIDLWGLQGVRPSVTSYGTQPSTNTYPLTSKTPTQYLNAALNEFALEFEQAKSATLATGNEYGYMIFQNNSTGRLEISGIREGGVQSVCIGCAIVDLEIHHKAAFDNISVLGGYHTHPKKCYTDDVIMDDGKKENVELLHFDGGPISSQDFENMVAIGKTEGKYSGYPISDGFFYIADDLSGGRYAFVVENLTLAIEKLPPFESELEGGANSQISSDIKASALYNSSGGEKYRQYYNKRLTGTGLPLYYSSDINSTSLRRIPERNYFMGKLPSVY